MSTILAIDLGSTHLRAWIHEQGPSRPLELGPDAALPSVLACAADGELRTGDAARRLAFTVPERVAFDFVRVLGRPFDELREHELTRAGWSRSADGQAELALGDRTLDASAAVSRLCEAVARKLAGAGELAEVVLIARAHWGQARRRAFVAALAGAGLTVTRIVDSTTAAAWAYRERSALDRRETLLVVDAGGGAVDVAVVEVGPASVEVLASVGSSGGGGDDLDDELVEWMLADFRARTDVDLGRDEVVRARMRDAAGRAKRQLTEQERCELHLAHLWADAGGAIHFDATLERGVFERFARGLADRCAALVDAALDRARTRAEDLAQLVMVGGAARIPLLQDRLEGRLSRVPWLELEGEGTLLAPVIASVVARAARLVGEGEGRPAELHDIASRELAVAWEGAERLPLVPLGGAVPWRWRHEFADASSPATVLLYEGGGAAEAELVASVALPAGSTELIVELGEAGLLELRADGSPLQSSWTLGPDEATVAARRDAALAALVRDRGSVAPAEPEAEVGGADPVDDVLEESESESATEA